jgi:predicted dehydrogenase
MYLRASDKAAGVGNFHSAVATKLIGGEQVLKAHEKGLAPRHGLEPVRFEYASSLEKPVGVGLIGVGQQGLRLLTAMNPKFVDVKAIADIRASRRGQAAKVAKAAKAYDAYAALIKAAKDDGVEAVIIALPSHLHAEAALAALDAGLHVFVETPLALSVADAKKVARKAAEKNLVLAVGQQRRYNLIYDHALEMVRRNLLADIHYVRAQWHLPKPEKKPAKADAKKDDPKKPKPEVKKPEEFVIDWWQEMAAEDSQGPHDGYASPDELAHWQLYEKFSGGLLAELGSQLFAAAAMFVAATPNRDPARPYPLSVAGSGSQILPGTGGDIDDHVHCIFEYAIAGYVEDEKIPPKARKKIALQFDLVIGNEFDGYGETILGRQGSLVLENEKKAMLFQTSDVDKSLHVIEKRDAKGVPWIEVPKDGKLDEDVQSLGRMALEGADAGFATELEHWAFCCRQPVGSQASPKPRSDAAAGLYTAVLTVAASRAVKLDQRIDFKPEWFDLKSDETPDGL